MESARNQSVWMHSTSAALRGGNVVWLALVSVLCMLPAAGVMAAERVALVIGNDRYQHIGGLDNAGRDARAVAAKLKASPLRFSVIEGYDVDEATLLEKLERFRQALSASGEVGLFYYAGHGAQISRGAGAEEGAENLLMPVDVNATTQSQLVAGSVRLSQVLDVMRRGGRDVNVVLLDACRDNPALDARGSRGLAPVASESGFLIQFATAANRTASDGPPGSNGAYTGVLLEWLDRPDLSLDDVFTEVTGEVRRRTGQEPWRSSTLGRRVFLAGKSTLQRPVVGIPAHEGEVRIAVSPAKAQVRIDGVLLGSGSQVIREPSGKVVLIRAEADGHEPLEERVRVQGGKVADVRLRLLPAVTPEPVPSPAVPLPTMVRIPAGRFEMGSPSFEEGRDADEGPLTTIEVAAFELGKHEVTVAEFRRFVEATGYRTEAERDVDVPDDAGDWAKGPNPGCFGQDSSGWGFKAGRSWRDPGLEQTGSHPVVCVSWNDAQAYIEWLNRESGLRYRLPSEAEQEYAIRAGSPTPYAWGTDADQACAFANVADQSGSPSGKRWGKFVACNDGARGTASVGSYAVNRLGLHDTVGNVQEWGQDCYAAYPSGTREAVAVEQTGCGRRVLRGGSWVSVPGGLRSADRDGDTPTYRDTYVGFRLARTF